MIKRQRKVITTGLSLIILIFVIVCLVVFAALSMSGAAADYRLNEKLATRTSQYYEASNKANLVLEKIDRYLSEQYGRGLSEEEYYEELKKLPKAAAVDSFHIDGRLATWKQPIEEGQSLFVAIEVRYPQKGETFFEVEQWRVLAEGEWEKDTRIPVYQKGSDPFQKGE